MEAFKNFHKTSAIQPDDENGWAGIVPTIAFAVCGVVLLVLMSYRPVHDMTGVGMVFPFSLSEDEILVQVGAAGGRVVRFGGFGHMAVVVRDDGMVPQSDDFGALFTLSPLIASACFDLGETKNAF
ncbi:MULTISPECIES: hypothetical protein [Thalassospira]|uniref:Uncharacterized protein n=2 Tax=Thalassospira TaxID=168934 RepID=A0A367WBA9_9PROT|nr:MULTISPECIES: hypothetical protein [Thalassospira]MDG4717803.1 hypothetical protein [Thalassospira sp. FZY0004]RCK38744.1 hypothetical protein TH19_02735 [Thalassospira profundimaris]